MSNSYRVSSPHIRKSATSGTVWLLVAVALLWFAPPQARSADHGGPSSERRSVAGDYGALPLAFEANAGQADEATQFVSRGPGYTVSLKKDEAVLALRRTDARSRKRFEASKFFRTPRFRELHKTTVVRVKPVGANHAPVVRPLDPLPGRSNYFIGNNPKFWRIGISRYGRVKYADVYPGIDLTYYGAGDQLEFDFEVAAGADPGQVRLRIESEGDLVVGRDGSVQVRLEGADLNLLKPVIYQLSNGKRTSVPGGFVRLTGNEVGLRIGPYDRRKPLVIDPVLSYSTYIGGSGDDWGEGVAVDSAGNAYIAGFTSSVDFPTLNGYPSSGNANGVCFISKLDPTGKTLLFSTYLGGTGGDWCLGVGLDAANNAYVAGSTLSSDFPVVGGYQTSLTNPNGSAFVARIDTTQSGQATLVYSSYLGGGGNAANSIGDQAIGVAVDPNGRAYLTGQTASDTSASPFPTTAGAYQTTLSSTNGNAFLSVIDTNQTGAASLLYSTYLGGSSQGFGDYGVGVAIDGLGRGYITGQTTASSPTPFPTTATAFQNVLNSTQGNAFVSVIDPYQSGTQSLVYSTYLGGSTALLSADFGNAVAVDVNGYVFVTGDTTSPDFPVTAGTFQTTNSPNGRAFVAKFDTTQSGASSLLYSTFLGGTDGTEGEVGNGITVDGNGNALVVGSTSSTDFPVSADAFQSNQRSVSWNAYLAELNPTGTALIYSTYLGGSCADGDAGATVTLDSSSNAYVVGSTCSTDFPTQPSDAYHTGLSGGYDAFITKFIRVPQIQSVSPASALPGQLVTIAGTGFGTTGTVLFNGTALQTVSWSDTQILVRCPIGPVTSQMVVNVLGLMSNAVDFTALAAPVPVLTDISPSSGPVGTHVTITGQNLAQTAGTVSYSLTFNGVAAPVISSSNTSVTTSVPYGATSGLVIVSIDGQTSNGLQFSVPQPPYISSISPNSGFPGDAVAIYGSGFGASQGSSTVTLSGAVATPSSWSDGYIGITIPTGATAGPLVVTVAGAKSNAVIFDIPLKSIAGSGAQPTSIELRPSLVSLVVGDTYQPSLQDTFGITVTGASWSSSDTTVVSLSSDDPPVVTALAPGTATLTASSGNFIATATVQVFDGQIPYGTELWRSESLPGGTTVAIVDGLGQPGDPSVFSIETYSDGKGYVRALGDRGQTKSVAAAGVPYYKGWQAAADGFGGVLLSSPNSLVDTAAGRLKWRLDNVANMIPVFAVAPDGSVYVVRHSEDATAPNYFVDVVDPNTGVPRSRFPIPNSINYSGGSQSQTAPSIGQPLILANGDYYLQVITQTGDVEAGTNFRRYDVQLLRITQTGASSLIPVKTLTSTTGLPNLLNDQLLPDGDHGVLTSWCDTSLPTACVLMAHIADPALGNVGPTFLLPYYSTTGGVVGENGRVFVSGTCSDLDCQTRENAITAIDVNSGPLWTSKSSLDHVAVMAATDGLGVVATENNWGQDPTQVFRLDSNGTRTNDTYNPAALANPRYAETHVWLGLTTAVHEYMDNPIPLVPSGYPVPDKSGDRAADPGLKLVAVSDGTDLNLIDRDILYWLRKSDGSSVGTNCGQSGQTGYCYSVNEFVTSISSAPPQGITTDNSGNQFQDSIRALMTGDPEKLTMKQNFGYFLPGQRHYLVHRIERTDRNGRHCSLQIPVLVIYKDRDPNSHNGRIPFIGGELPGAQPPTVFPPAYMAPSGNSLDVPPPDCQ